MFHANTRRLIEDWRELRADRLAPTRAAITPEGFRGVLTQLFILGAEGQTNDRFRLAGGLLVDLHDRELRGSSFLSLWPFPDRTTVAEALEEARRTGVPAVLEASAWTADGCEVGLEIVLAPLIGPSGALDRVLGLYQPTSGVRGLHGRPIQELTLRCVEVMSERVERPKLRLAALDGERLI